MLAALLSLPADGAAGQLTVATEVTGAGYPREPENRAAIGGELRGWSSIEFENPIGKGVEFSGDLLVYWSNEREALLDGEARIAWRGDGAALAAGLLRERWGRFTDSPLDPLGPANTPFTLVEPELRLAQPTVRGSLFFGAVSVDVYTLIGHRAQPLPDSDGRLGFGVETTDVAHRGALGDQAVAARVSGTGVSLDWAAHVYGGLNRRPTFVPRFTPDGRFGSVDAVYTEIVQVGGELETTRADWRFLGEGFTRTGAIDVTGQDRTYTYLAGAAEYQRLGAFDGAYNIIPRLEVMADTRGDRADIPFASSARAGLRVAQTRRLPLQAEMAYAYDWAFQGHGAIASIEKELAEAPTVTLGFRFTAFSKGQTPSILDVWRDDLELYGFIRVELSR